MLHVAEQHRETIHAHTERQHKSSLGQFMTPATVARFMADRFAPAKGTIRLLDPGAGLGALTCAFLDHQVQRKAKVSATAYEIDAKLQGTLAETLAGYTHVQSSVLKQDFLADAARLIQAQERPFTHAILNPPYKKIATDSDARLHARAAGLETVNLYSAFVGLALALLQSQGQLVAIIPRSFCNGPYYRPFRDFILARAAIAQIHLFDSRDTAFSDDDVLQENIIVRLVRDAEQGEVRITQSRDDTFTDLREQVLPFTDIVHPDDPERFIHIPDGTPDPLASLSKVRHTLAEAGLAVSTGPVVDFRLREHLRKMPEANTVPLIYPAHLDGLTTTWPMENIKKWNAIERNDQTQKWLFPGGSYVLLRRFSSKEESRRLHAYLLKHEDVGHAEWLGFENHTNVFHVNKKGLSDDLALGLYCWLNSTALDQHLRRFSGHTQVNATDLRNMRHPGSEDLAALGRKAKTKIKKGALDQATIDGLVLKELA